MASRTPKTASSKITTLPRKAKVSVSILQESAPRLPHEQDESAGSQASEPRKVIKQAADDLKRGQKDTDRGKEMNRVYKKLKAGT